MYITSKVAVLKPITKSRLLSQSVFSVDNINRVVGIRAKLNVWTAFIYMYDKYVTSKVVV